MFVLENFGIKTLGKAFLERKAQPNQYSDISNELAEDNYSLKAKHLSKNIYLFKSTKNYLLLNLTESASPNAEGVVVENVEKAVETLWSKNTVDVFDGGAVGELSLHLPAFRDATDNIIYLVDKSQADNFYINDFQTIEK